MKIARFAKETGASLIEIILLVSLVGTLLAITTINLFRPSSQSKLQGTAKEVTSLLADAQTKAMNTDTSGDPQSDNYGVHFTTNQYILFKGSTYDPAAPGNFGVDLPAGLTFTPNLPCPFPPNGCNSVIFQRISGEIANFDPARNSLCINEATGSKVSLVVNFLGVVDERSSC